LAEILTSLFCRNFFRTVEIVIQFLTAVRMKAGTTEPGPETHKFQGFGFFWTPIKAQKTELDRLKAFGLDKPLACLWKEFSECPILELYDFCIRTSQDLTNCTISSFQPQFRQILRHLTLNIDKFSRYVMEWKPSPEPDFSPPVPQSQSPPMNPPAVDFPDIPEHCFICGGQTSIQALPDHLKHCEKICELRLFLHNTRDRAMGCLDLLRTHFKHAWTSFVIEGVETDFPIQMAVLHIYTELFTLIKTGRTDRHAPDRIEKTIAFACEHITLEPHLKRAFTLVLGCINRLNFVVQAIARRISDIQNTMLSREYSETGPPLEGFVLVGRVEGRENCYIARLPSYHQLFTVEVMDKLLFSSVRREARLLHRLRQVEGIVPYCFTLLGRDHVFFVTLYSACTLHEFLHTTELGPDRLPVMLNIMKQLLSTIAATHELKIAHRDLHAGNLLLTSNGQLRIANFRNAAGFDEPVDPVAAAVPLECSECMTRELESAQAEDFRSAGSIMCEFLTGRTSMDEDARLMAQSLGVSQLLETLFSSDPKKQGGALKLIDEFQIVPIADHMFARWTVRESDYANAAEFLADFVDDMRSANVSPSYVIGASKLKGVSEKAAEPPPPSPSDRDDKPGICDVPFDVT
jgi:hypothetical protein